VLRALEESEVTVDAVAGTSIGAFIATLLAFGKRADEMQEITRDLNWLDVSGISLSRLGLLSNKKLGQFIREHVGEVKFDDSDIPLSMIVTDIESGKRIVLKDGDVASAVMASACIPGVFVPCEREGVLLVDGGVLENVPVSPLQSMDVDIIIAVDLNSGKPQSKPTNIVEILIRSFTLMINSATELQTKDADILIRPDLSSFNMVDVKQVDDLIEAGYAEAVRVLQELDG
jgi:NTE family protein